MRRLAAIILALLGLAADASAQSQITSANLAYKGCFLLYDNGIQGHLAASDNGLAYSNIRQTWFTVLRSNAGTQSSRGYGIYEYLLPDQSSYPGTKVGTVTYPAGINQPGASQSGTTPCAAAVGLTDAGQNLTLGDWSAGGVPILYSATNPGTGATYLNHGQTPDQIGDAFYDDYPGDGGAGRLYISWGSPYGNNEVAASLLFVRFTHSAPLVASDIHGPWMMHNVEDGTGVCASDAASQKACTVLVQDLSWSAFERLWQPFTVGGVTYKFRTGGIRSNTFQDGSWGNEYLACEEPPGDVVTDPGTGVQLAYGVLNCRFMAWWPGILTDGTANGQASFHTDRSCGTVINTKQPSCSDPDVPLTATISAISVQSSSTPCGAVGAGVSCVTTTGTNTFATGAWVNFAVTDSTPALDGDRQVTVIDSTHFTVPVAVTVAGTTGVYAQLCHSGTLSGSTGPGGKPEDCSNSTLKSNFLTSNMLRKFPIQLVIGQAQQDQSGYKDCQVPYGRRTLSDAPYQSGNATYPYIGFGVNDSGGHAVDINEADLTGSVSFGRQGVGGTWYGEWTQNGNDWSIYASGYPGAASCIPPPTPTSGQTAQSAGGVGPYPSFSGLNVVGTDRFMQSYVFASDGACNLSGGVLVGTTNCHNYLYDGSDGPQGGNDTEAIVPVLYIFKLSDLAAGLNNTYTHRDAAHGCAGCTAKQVDFTEFQVLAAPFTTPNLSPLLSNYQYDNGLSQRDGHTYGASFRSAPIPSSHFVESKGAYFRPTTLPTGQASSGTARRIYVRMQSAAGTSTDIVNVFDLSGSGCTATTPTSPTISVGTTTTTNQSITLAWTPESSANADTYTVYRCVGTCGSALAVPPYAAVPGGTVNAHGPVSFGVTDAGSDLPGGRLAASTHYTYIVTASNCAPGSGVSAQATFLTQADPTPFGEWMAPRHLFNLLFGWK